MTPLDHLDAEQGQYSLRVMCPHGKAKMLMGVDDDDILRSSLDLIHALRHGCSIERVSADVARKTPFGCNECLIGLTATTIDDLMEFTD